MDNMAFLVRQDEILHKRPSPIREVQLRHLEAKALYEECQEIGLEAVWEASHGSDAVSYHPKGWRPPHGR